MADNESDILAQFKEFLDAKAASEKESADAEDFEVEIWDKDGRGVRTRRSHAKPFLQSLGIDVDAPTSDGDGKGAKDSGKSGSSDSGTGRKTGSGAASGAPAGGVARKYFAPKPKTGS